MNVIYEPAGRAREYAPLAANLYKGCPHGCLYCYAPGALRRSREDFVKVAPRTNVLKAFRRDLERLPRGSGPVLLSFSCDPYPELERELGLTRAALITLIAHRVPVRILTKNPLIALERDFAFLARAAAASDPRPLIGSGLTFASGSRPLVEFGVTLAFTEESSREHWEPNAGALKDRRAALRLAHDLGIPTWVSMEPVVDPAQALAVIDQLSRVVDVWRVGKLNHDKLNESKVDWPKFLADALELLVARNARYRIKEDLWNCADDATLARHQRSIGVPEE